MRLLKKYGKIFAEHSNCSMVELHIGDLYASKTPVNIKTLLGSCVAACLFDPIHHIGGMNHFLLPGDVADLDYSTRYGINAMEVLINEMMKLGANRAALKAKIFGGADIFFVNHTMMMVGRKNINFIQRFLETENIPIVGRRMGGHQGIVVHCFTDNFEVFVKPVSMSRFKRTEQAELTFREKLFHEHTDNSKDDITLF